MSNIPIKDAVKQAKASLIDLYQDDPPRELALEEIELTDQGDRKLWAVTLGFHRAKKITALNSGGGLQGLGLPIPQIEHRVYKTVFVDAATGEFVKMDIRQVQ